MKYIRTIGLCLLLFVSMVIFSTMLIAQAADGNPLAGTQAEKDVENAVLNAITAHRESTPIYAMFQISIVNIQIDQGGEWATAGMVLADTKAVDLPATEPGLAILHWEANSWQAALPGDLLWRKWLNSLPPTLMDPETVDYWNSVLALKTCQLPRTPVLSGFYLPWQYGQTAQLTQSVHHDMYDADAATASYPEHYAFDFVRAGGVAMFNIWASRSGTIVGFKDDVPNDDHTNVNYVLIKDSVYNVYELYLHLAQNSIPPHLKSVGAVVKRSEVIGIVDNTGNSTGSHLHFQAEIQPTSWFNCSVDITFDDVTINGGRPRQKDAFPDNIYCYASDNCSSYQTYYVSGNRRGDLDDPTGDFTNIHNGDVITDSNLAFSGWGADATSGFLSAQALIGTKGVWQTGGLEIVGTPFSGSINFCSLSIPNGIVDLGLRLTDNSGNVIDRKPLRSVILSVQCPPPPPPVCQPGPGQVALFADPNFQGVCAVFGPNAGYLSTSLNIPGINTASSVVVGSGARASLYSKDSFSGREETFYQSDTNLADNRIQDDSVVSLIVQSANDMPFGLSAGWPLTGQVINGNESATIYWNSMAGLSQYQLRLIRANNTLTTTWLSQPWITSDSLNLSPGVYSWQVRGRTSPTASTWITPTNWTDPQTFTVTQASYTSNSSVSLPFTDDVVNSGGWTATGWWKVSNTATPAIPGSSTGTPPYWWAGNTNPNGNNYELKRSSSLTSVPIILDANAVSYLDFYYYYQTEVKPGDYLINSPLYWDQRLVQVVLQDGHVETVYQLSGDIMQAWKQSPHISLAKYIGKTIRIRFYFETVDGSDGQTGVENNFSGWFVDKINVNTTTPATCSPDAYEGANGNNTPATAYHLTLPYQSLSTGRICQNDPDYYSFDGKAGDQVQITTDTYQTATHMDTVMALIDSDGTSVLAFNDDNPFSGRVDSYIHTTLPRDGTYYIRVQAFNFPNYYWTSLPDNGQSRVYDLHFGIDHNYPQIANFSPPEQARYLKNLTQAMAEIIGTTSGLESIEFFWHTSDWMTTTWKSLGTAVQLNNHYSVSLDPSVIGDQDDMAVYVVAKSRAGLSSVLGSTHIATDFTPPTTQFLPMAMVEPSNVLNLNWKGSDSRSGLDYFVLDERIDNLPWQHIYTSTQLTTQYEVVSPGHSYWYRLHGVDQAGNIEGDHIISTTVPAANVLCQLNETGKPIGDLFENDNSRGQAKYLAVGGVQERNFCNPQTSDFTGDEDWITTTVQVGNTYAFQAAVFQPGKSTARLAAPILQLFASNGATLIKESSPLVFPATGLMLWKADRSGIVSLRVLNLDPRALAISYSLSVSQVNLIFYLPLIR